jgi:hypothetical protein
LKVVSDLKVSFRVGEFVEGGVGNLRSRPLFRSEGSIAGHSMIMEQYGG